MNFKKWDKRIPCHFSDKWKPMAPILYIMSSKIFILYFKDLYDLVPCYLFQTHFIEPLKSSWISTLGLFAVPGTWKTICQLCAFLFVIPLCFTIFYPLGTSLITYQYFYFSSNVNLNISSWMISIGIDLVPLSGPVRSYLI